jgi:hypothetical protein
MDGNPVYLLIHSPLVGGLTWSLVADEIRQRGHSTVVPTLVDSPESDKPFWKQHAESVTPALSQVPQNQKLVLVAHSGAGPLLPVIRQGLPNPVQAYIFVDAGIPRDGATRLDLMRAEDPEWARRFEESLQRGARFPNWGAQDLRAIIPDENLREQLVAEIRPRGLDFFTEPIPVFDDWPDAPCVYVQFSAPYQRPAAQARQAGWKMYELRAGHFHMLVDVPVVTEMIMRAVHAIAKTS